MPTYTDDLNALQDGLQSKVYAEDESRHMATKCMLKMAATGWAVGTVAGIAAGTATAPAAGVGGIPAAFFGYIFGGGAVLLKDSDCDPVREKLGINEIVRTLNGQPNLAD